MVLKEYSSILRRECSQKLNHKIKNVSIDIKIEDHQMKEYGPSVRALQSICRDGGCVKLPAFEVLVVIG